MVAFLQGYKIFFVILFFCLGVFVNLFGLKMFNITTFVIACVFSSFAAAAFFYHFVDLNTETWILWFIFILCVGIGSGIGVLAVRYKEVGFFGMGFGLGVIAALLIYQYIIANFIGSFGEAFLYGFAILFGIFGGYSASKYWRGMVISATAFIGSYMIVRAISVYLGGFPNEIELAEGQAEFTWWSVLYLLLLALITLIGLKFQYNNKKPEDDAKLVSETLKGASRYQEILLENA